jgi:homeobox protein ESX1
MSDPNHRPAAQKLPIPPADPPRPVASPAAAPPVAPPPPAGDPPSGKPGQRVREIGGPKGPEPTRYGDWEQKGRASDF